jgi:hypothetical protein
VTNSKNIEGFYTLSAPGPVAADPPRNSMEKARIIKNEFKVDNDASKEKY